MEKQIILALLPADDLATGSFPIYGLLKEMDQMMNYCNQWKCNLNESKVTALNK
jgi:hypothetical protein